MKSNAAGRPKHRRTAMPDPKTATVAIVDYGLGNLFSVKHACESVGIRALITASHQEILSADAVILPGVGAFGDAMKALKRLDLVGPLSDIVGTEKPLIGVCLGMQLLMTQSYEFGEHRGLDIIQGPVLRFEDPGNGQKRLKVPHVGWNEIYQRGADPLFSGVRDGEFMYFIHSFYAKPEDAGVVSSVSRYGTTEFCASVCYKNVHAFQFHPERSGPEGLKIYKNLLRR